MARPSEPSGAVLERLPPAGQHRVVRGCGPVLGCGVLVAVTAVALVGHALVARPLEIGHGQSQGTDGEVAGGSQQLPAVLAHAQLVGELLEAVGHLPGHPPQQQGEEDHHLHHPDPERPVPPGQAFGVGRRAEIGVT